MLKKLVLVIGVAAMAAPAHAVFCTYAAYAPASMYRFLLSALASRDIAAIPGLGNVAPGQLALVRDGFLLGSLGYVDDVRTGKASLAVHDAHGAAIATFDETAEPCPPDDPRGMCRKTEFRTEISATLATDAPAFGVVTGWGGTYYFLYEHQVGASEWRAQYDDAIAWLLGAVETSEPIVLVAASAFEAAWMSLASDPEMLPYLGLIKIYDFGGVVVVKGRVPSNYHYKLVVEALHSAGFWDARFDIIIDTGLIAVSPPLPDYHTCFYSF